MQILHCSCLIIPFSSTSFIVNSLVKSLSHLKKHLLLTVSPPCCDFADDWERERITNIDWSNCKVSFSINYSALDGIYFNLINLKNLGKAKETWELIFLNIIIVRHTYTYKRNIYFWLVKYTSIFRNLCRNIKYIYRLSIYYLFLYMYILFNIYVLFSLVYFL